jgi:uncharacterized protein affecting Mg2+/Co2+ transport
MSRSRPAVLVLLALLATGCGYALAGRGNALPATIRVIGVPEFQNTSSVPDFDRALTDAVRIELLSKGNYTILPQAQGVDGLFVGTITNVTLQPAAFTSDNQVSRHVIIVTANVEFKEVATDRVIWANPSFQVRDEYQISTTTQADATSLLTTDESARDRIARAFARSVVTSIFEAF